MSARTVAGAGALGLSAAFALAPLAHAAPAGKDKGSDTSSGAKPGAKPGAKAAAGTTSVAADEPTPNYGFQKVRFGVRVKDGADVPAGTTTVGTKLHVKVTGTLDNPAGAVDEEFDCTTEDITPDVAGDATFCTHRDNQPDAGRLRSLARKNGISPRLVAEPTPGDADTDTAYLAGPGATVTITQKTVNKNLVIDPATATLAPCDVGAPDAIPVCSKTPGEPATGPDDVLSTDEVFEDTGLAPIAKDDSARTDQGEPVVVNVAGNDDDRGADVTGLEVVTDPKHGRAKVDTPAVGTARGSARAAASTPAVIRYTPAAGFSGKDTFRYSIATANGTATATVTVTVVAAPTLIPPTSTTKPNDTGPLADTGSNSEGLVDLGALLLATGAAATIIGRRRRITGRHARSH